MIERRFKCEVCGWESESYRMGLLVDDFLNEKSVAQSILIHFQTKHPKLEPSNHLTSIDKIMGSYRSSLGKVNEE